MGCQGCCLDIHVVVVIVVNDNGGGGEGVNVYAGHLCPDSGGDGGSSCLSYRRASFLTASLHSVFRPLPTTAVRPFLHSLLPSWVLFGLS